MSTFLRSSGVRFDLRSRMLSVFGAMGIFLFGLSSVSYIELRGLVGEYQEVLFRRHNLLIQSGQMSTGVFRRLSGLRGYMLTDQEKQLELYESGSILLKEGMDYVELYLNEDDDRQMLEEIRREMGKYDQVQEQILSLWKGGERAKATELLTQGTVIAEATAQMIYDFNQHQVERTDDDEARLNAAVSASEQKVIVLGGLGFLLSAIVALLMSNSIAKAVRHVALVAHQVSVGDLTVSQLPTRRTDEIGMMARTINEMVESLRKLITSVTAAAHTVVSSATQLAAVSGQTAHAATGAAQAVTHVAEGTGEQAHNASEADKTMNELQVTIQQIAEGANASARDVQQAVNRMNEMALAMQKVATDASHVTESSKRAAQAASTGAEVVERTLDGMERVRAAVENSADRIKELERVSIQIGEITEAISGIAEQTNLLALNAAIEAARAGEHGRGFGVVADEVRKLAERASQSAKSITALVTTIQNQTAQSAAAMEQGTKEVHQGSKLATEAEQALREILHIVSETTGEIDDIARAVVKVQQSAKAVVRSFDSMASIIEENSASTEEMAASSTMVGNAVQRIADLSQQNAAAAEEVSAAVEQVNASAEEVAHSAQGLSAVAQDLTQQVSHFKL